MVANRYPSRRPPVYVTSDAGNGGRRRRVSARAVEDDEGEAMELLVARLTNHRVHDGELWVLL